MRQLTFSTFIKATPEEVWQFFSSPVNLSKITPPEMNFRILTPLPDSMYPGMMIGYHVSPFPGFRMYWLTEITQISEGRYFIDEQRSGPYRIWHHEHHFLASPGGVEMTDILTYSVPFGILGRLLDELLIGRRVDSIFRFRAQRIRELFPGS